MFRIQTLAACIAAIVMTSGASLAHDFKDLLGLPGRALADALDCGCRAFPNEGNYVVAGQPITLKYDQIQGSGVDSCPTAIDTQVSFPQEGDFDLTLTCEGDVWTGEIRPARIAQAGHFTFVLTPLFDEPADFGPGVPAVDADLRLGEALTIRNTNRFSLQIVPPKGFGRAPRAAPAQATGQGRAPACMCEFARKRLDYIDRLIKSYTDADVQACARKAGVMGISQYGSFLSVAANNGLVLDTVALPDGAPRLNFSKIAIATARARGKAPGTVCTMPSEGTDKRNVGGSVDPETCDLTMPVKSCRYGFAHREIVRHELEHVSQCRKWNAVKSYVQAGSTSKLRFSGGWSDTTVPTPYAGLANNPAQLGAFEKKAYEEGREEIYSWAAVNCPDL